MTWRAIEAVPLPTPAVLVLTASSRNFSTSTEHGTHAQSKRIQSPIPSWPHPYWPMHLFSLGNASTNKVHGPYAYTRRCVYSCCACSFISTCLCDCADATGSNKHVCVTSANVSLCIIVCACLLWHCFHKYYYKIAQVVSRMVCSFKIRSYQVSFVTWMKQNMYHFGNGLFISKMIARRDSSVRCCLSLYLCVSVCECSCVYGCV